MMRRTLIATLAASLVVLVATGPKPALSMPANATLADGPSNAGVVYDVAKRRGYSKGWNKGHHYRGYSHRYQPYAYYRPHGYYRPHYRPYASYNYPYYHRRPGVSLWFGF